MGSNLLEFSFMIHDMTTRLLYCACHSEISNSGGLAIWQLVHVLISQLKPVRFAKYSAGLKSI